MGTEPVPAADAAEVGTPLLLKYRDRHRAIGVAAVTGEQLLFALLRVGAALPALCGGKGVCGTCRVHVPAAWRRHLPEPLKREARMLDYLGAAEGDRLSCRLVLSVELQGLEIHSCNQKALND